MRKLSITTAKNRYDKGIKAGEVSWDKLAKRLMSLQVTDETFAEYQAAGNDKLAIKDVGWFIGGPMDPPQRRKANLKFRDVLTLDADHLEGWEMDEVSTAYRDLGLEFVAHSSHSHSDDAPRLRYILPFTRPVAPEEYEAIARRVASWAGIDYFDDTTYQVSRVMFWPSRASDADEYMEHHSGNWLDPDQVLDSYEDWRDWGSWPTSSRETIDRDPGQKAEDPYSKPGVIGAFNRAFEVPHAIVEFDLPYEPSGMGEDRYTYLGGTSVDGCIYYPDDGHLYSWHESDPARGNSNAWDLVRVHRFGELDDGVDPDTPVGKLESQKAMQAFALGLDPVAEEMAADEGFEDLGDEEDDGKPQRLSYDGIRSGIVNRQHPITDAERREHTRRIAAANLTSAQESVLAGLIRGGHEDPSPTKQSIMDEIKETRQLLKAQTEDGDPNDIELDLIERVLDDWFAGGAHIRRFARQFWVYEHGVWVRREDETIRGLMQKSFIKLRRERPRECLELVAALGETSTSAATSKLWQMFCAHVTSSELSLDPMQLLDYEKPPVVNCLNGHVRFNRKGKIKLYPHDPELFLTSQIPFDYDADADTSHWDAFCELIFHDSLEPDEMQRHLEEVGGYLLQPWRDIATFFLMRGAPAAGKSTFGLVLSKLMGDSLVSQEIARYNGSNAHDTAGLVGKLVLMDEDFNKGDLLPAGFIKRISEAKFLTANPKNKDEFNFISRAVPFVIANDWPPTRDHSGALQRRLVCWDLPAIPLEQQDDDARRALLTVGLPGVLARFVEGFARLYRRGGWDLPDECLEAAERWETHTDLVRLFLREAVVSVEGKFLKRSDLHGLFVHWYRESVPGGKVPGKQQFLERVQGILGPATKRNGQYGWVGLEYRAPEFDDV